ncbi:response regulator transcription factor [Streptomyces sp. NPDC047017]|uniref:response regulator transcription factor n=1 Tax=Streptomyces sp. NPDC047017 TaxID=3155024 RepID=UPI0033FEA6CC
MPGILVVDDQYLIRAGIVALLRTNPRLPAVSEAVDGPTAIESARGLRPEVILMDIRMPGMTGLSAARQILDLDLRPRPRILVLTTYDTDDYVYAALKAGCSGFLLKDMPPGQLLDAVSATLHADLLIAPARLKHLIEVHAPAARPAAMTALDQLTGREIEVLELVGRGMANDDIARRIHVTESTVKTHLHNLMTKLGLRSRAQAVVVAYETRLVPVGGTLAPGM